MCLLAQLRVSQPSQQHLLFCAQQLPKRRQCAARYQQSRLEDLFQQARQAPTVTVDTTQPQQQHAAFTPLQQPGPQQQQPTLVQHQQHTAKSSLPPRQPQQASNTLQPHQQLQQLPDRRLRPSRFDFGVMFAQLQAWQQRHLTAHVPRHCFDAPELGAWVRHLRKLHKEGQLEQWKVDSLNALCFEWQLSDQEAKWHHLYHQLRRYREMYGSTDVDVTRSSEDSCDWHRVAWWLRKQAKLLAKQKLSSQQRAMLQQLRVRLTVPKQLVQRTAQLQALNLTERRQLRKKWKLQDNMLHEAGRMQRQQELQQLLQERQQQQKIVQRREQLAQQAVLSASMEHAHAAPGTTTPLGVGSGQDCEAAASKQQLARLALQQLQQVQQAVSQQPAVQVEPAVWAFGIHARRQQSQEQQGAVMPVPGLAVQLAASVDDHDSAASQVQEPQQQAEQQRLEPSQQQQQEPAGAEQQGQRQQHLRTEAGALLFAPNRRRKRIGHRSRHEQWLAAADS